MAYLKTSEFLCVYELPTVTNKEDEEKLKSAILNITAVKTTILFTHQNLFDNYASVIYKMQNGIVAEKFER